MNYKVIGSNKSWDFLCFFLENIVYSVSWLVKYIYINLQLICLYMVWNYLFFPLSFYLYLSNLLPFVFIPALFSDLLEFESCLCCLVFLTEETEPRCLPLFEPSDLFLFPSLTLLSHSERTLSFSGGMNQICSEVLRSRCPDVGGHKSNIQLTLGLFLSTLRLYGCSCSWFPAVRTVIMLYPFKSFNETMINLQ